MATVSRPAPTVRYAVVGLGYIAQIAVLPAFKNAKNSELVALISADKKKLKKLSQKYGVPYTASYENFEECLRDADVDAVYIALPNSLHREYAVRAARLGVHVLCEKPLAVTAEECEDMIEIAVENEVKLMTAYRLHFEPANLDAISAIHSGKIGDPRIFHSVFTMKLEDPDNIRLKSTTGGGPLYDIGIYCINAARYLFRSEPIEVTSCIVHGSDERFTEVPESAVFTMKFPKDRLASIAISFNTEETSRFEVLGTKGSIALDPAYDFAAPLQKTISRQGKKQKRRYPKTDQFGAELVYFSNCILNDTEVEPSGIEGWKDVRIIEALIEANSRGERIQLRLDESGPRPGLRQKIVRPAIRPPSLVNVSPPSS